MNLLQALTDNIIVDREKCTGCGVCVEMCPMDNLRLRLAPCRGACPLGVNAGGYVRLTARGEERQAFDMVRETLPFPGIMGRVCSQPCESSCSHVSRGSEGITIRAIKRYLADTFKDVPYEPAIAEKTGKKVAIIGSGPAGMMASHDLRLKGHGVTIFEAEKEPGGMLRWAIPEFRLPPDVLRDEISILESIGVLITTGMRINFNKIDEFSAKYDAVLIAAGCGSPKMLGIPGEDAAGVYYALPFLRAVRNGEKPSVGKKTVVIGGGNASLDAAQTALRLGSSEVTILCLEDEGDMPAFPWELSRARAEGVKVMNSWGTLRVMSDANCGIGVELQRCVRVFDDGGRFSPVYDSCDTHTVMADSVIIAAGQDRDDATIRSTAAGADPFTLQTRNENIFIAGDAATGPATVVEAMASGRRAAESIHRFITGEHLRYGREYKGPFITDFNITVPGTIAVNRVPVPEKKYAGTGDFGEIEQPLQADDARREAERCFSCGIPEGHFRTCWFCLPCEIECPQKAISVEIPYLLR